MEQTDQPSGRHVQRAKKFYKSVFGSNSSVFVFLISLNLLADDTVVKNV